MRKLKLDDAALQKLLDELDAHDSRVDSTKQRPDEFFSYRLPALRVDLDLSRDETISVTVPSRRLGPKGVYFLASNLVHSNCTCRVHLVTVRNNWQTVAGKVATCRYLPGTAGVHELFVRFDRPIDPATFATAASRTRILAADDSAVSQKLYEHLLDTMNVDLTCVTNGVEAVERALAETFDLLLMDVEMPEMDGLTAVQLLRGKGYVRPIVAVSARTDDGDRDRCITIGCDDFLAKPLTRESLADVVNRNKPEPLVSSMLDDQGMTDLIDRFVDGLAETILALEAAYGSQSRDDLERVARNLKGEAAGIGFQPITEAATNVEQAVKRGDELTDLRSKLTELIRLCMAARPATSLPPTTLDGAASPPAGEFDTAEEPAADEQAQAAKDDAPERPARPRKSERGTMPRKTTGKK